MVDEKARQQIADQASRLMAAGWRGNPNMSGDDRDFMSPSMRRKHDDKARAVVDFVLSQVQALSPGSTGETEGWRDIESAPKDGTAILAFGDEPSRNGDCGIIRQTRFVSSKGTPSEATTDGWFWWTEPVGNWGCRWAPSRWRPLPAPPSAMLSAAGER